MLDVLSDVLTRLSVQGTLYFRTSFTPPFGVRVPAFENVARFHYAHRGGCRVAVADAGPPLTLAQGDLVIVPHGASHCLISPDVPPDAAMPLDSVLETTEYDGTGVLVYGAEPADQEVQLICGHFSLAAGGRHVIFERLPPYLHLQNYGETAGPWLAETLRMLGSEAGRGRLGGDLVALRLSETILAQALRHYIEDAEAQGGPLAGFADPHLDRALAAIHGEPARAWTVEDLARRSGLSRSGFAERFARKIGVTPMAYITGWRMQIAREALAGDRVTVSKAAELAGYASEAAFSRAFKAEVGQPPSRYRAREAAG